MMSNSEMLGVQRMSINVYKVPRFSSLIQKFFIPTLRSFSYQQQIMVIDVKRIYRVHIIYNI